MTKTPAEHLETVLQRLLSKPNHTPKDREALEQAAFAVRTLPQVGTVKRDQLPRTLEAIKKAAGEVQAIFDLPNLTTEERKSWEKPLQDLRDAVSRMEDMRDKKAAKKTTPTMEPRR